MPDQCGPGLLGRSARGRKYASRGSSVLRFRAIPRAMCPRELARNRRRANLDHTTVIEFARVVLRSGRVFEEIGPAVKGPRRAPSLRDT